MADNQEILEKRWIEVKFYLILKKLTDNATDAVEALRIIKVLAAGAAIDPTYVYDIAINTLQNKDIHPTLREIAMLCKDRKQGMFKISRYLGNTKNALYMVMRRHTESTIPYEPKLRYTDKSRATISDLINFIEKIAEVSIDV